MHKKRASSVDITQAGSYDYMPNALMAANGTLPGAERLYSTLDVGDVCIWSIVSTEAVSYTFYVPPYATEPTAPMSPSSCGSPLPASQHERRGSCEVQPPLHFNGKRAL
jgi:hypothetical protein